mgnify:CR=1 FL=1
MRKLVIDIGNTRLKAAIFEEKKRSQQAVFARPSFEGLLEWLENFFPLDGCIVSNVAAEEPEIMAFLSKNSPVFIELSHKTPLPFSVKYKTPETLGRDRLAGLAAAQGIFPGKNCLVMDAGTCLKYDLLTADGAHLGGNIAPGARMRLRAMHEQTARLPLVEMALPGSEIGDSTQAALQNGGLFGMLLEMRGMVGFLKKKWPGLEVVVTGGDAEFFYKKLKIKKLRLEKELVLNGLNAILDFNLTSKV